MEESAFLVAVQRIVGRIEVEHDLKRRLIVGVEEEIDEQGLDRARIVVDPVVTVLTPPRALARRNLGYMGGIHAVEHAAIALFPLFALCEPDDVGGISIPLHPEIGKGAIFFYDGYPGGVGLCEQCYARIGDLLEKTYSLIAGCDCEKGCPSCIYSSKCGSGNVPLDKAAAVAILSLLLDRPESREWVVSAAG